MLGHSFQVSKAKNMGRLLCIHNNCQSLQKPMTVMSELLHCLPARLISSHLLHSLSVSHVGPLALTFTDYLATSVVLVQSLPWQCGFSWLPV